MEIRRYQQSDEPAVVQLWLDCGLVAPQNNPLQDIERKLAVNPEWFLIGCVAGELVATCMVGYEGHRGWINYLAVAPSAQRMGYASRILQEAERILCEVGCPKVNLQVRSSNQDVIQFYEKMGYTEDRVLSLGKRLEVDRPFEGLDASAE